VSFEEDVGRLEAIVRDLERDELNLDGALRLFEEGIARLRSASTALGDAQGRVAELVETAEGALTVVDRDD
jgi:exodeoxyribonuclease VII small subunit